MGKVSKLAAAEFITGTKGVIGVTEKLSAYYTQGNIMLFEYYATTSLQCISNDGRTVNISIPAGTTIVIGILSSFF